MTRHFLTLTDLSKSELRTLLKRATELKEMRVIDHRPSAAGASVSKPEVPHG